MIKKTTIGETAQNNGKHTQLKAQINSIQQTPNMTKTQRHCTKQKKKNRKTTPLQSEGEGTSLSSYSMYYLLRYICFPHVEHVLIVTVLVLDR